MLGKSVVLLAASLVLGWMPIPSVAQPSPAGPPAQESMRGQSERPPYNRLDRQDEEDDHRDWRDRHDQRNYYQRGPRASDSERGPMMRQGRGPRMLDHERGRHRETMNTMGPAMMGTNMRGHADMMGMMMILMDTDNDGTVSLQEFSAAHERIFKAMDASRDGRLTLEELQNFRPGLTKPSQEQR